MEKNISDVRILEAVIKEQNAKGANLPEDLDHWRYTWNKEGRLTELCLQYCGLNGSLSFKGLDALESLSCQDNQLSALDVGRNTALEYLDCEFNQLTALDVRNNPKLEDLCCGHNQLCALDVGVNAALTSLVCYNNGLEVLDVSANLALKYLDCDNNRLKALDISSNSLLEELCCKDNQITELDVSSNQKLISYRYDEGVRVIEVTNVPAEDREPAKEEEIEP